SLEDLGSAVIENAFENLGFDDDTAEMPASENGLSAADEMRMQKEIESVKFYIESGYTELAEKSIASLRSDFGQNIEIDKLEAELLLNGAAPTEESPAAAIVVDNKSVPTGDL